jgi:cbb3-type cytochrome oxidase maturation protein
MSVIFVLLPLALLLAAVAVLAFVWATRSGQFDDLETPALRILHEDDAPRGDAGHSQPASTTRARPPDTSPRIG